MNIKNIENQQYIDNFEGNFESWVNQISAIGFHGEPKNMCSTVQALVNAYHEIKGNLDPVYVPNFDTLMFFISISGASKNHSGNNESLQILSDGIELK